MYRVFFLNLLPAIMAIIAMNKKYFAFISYQRKDEKIAEWLRRKLENYHLPAKIRKGNVELPKDLRPIFRDSLELSGGFLAQEIEKALSDSRFLIVVCSPNSAKSPWVNKEVQFFIDNGREDCIIPYIVDGVPFSGDESTECFSPALLSLQGERELLGISINELGRDASVIKVVSRMFGLSFDTLWQRHNREQKRKRILWAIVAVMVVLSSLLISGYFFKVNREIEQKNREILEQNREIEEKSEEISKQNKEITEKNKEITQKNIEVTQKNEEIERQYGEIAQKNKEITQRNEEILRGRDKLLISQSRYLVSEAKKEYEKGNITKALRMALYALPKDLENPDRPYVNDGEIMLRHCEMPVVDDVYRKTLLPHIASVTSCEISPCGKYAVTSSRDCTAIIWELLTGIPAVPPLIHNGTVASARFSPCGNYVVTGSWDNTACVWNVATGKLVTAPLKHNQEVKYAMFTHDSKFVVTVSGDKRVRIWDAATGKRVIDSIKHPETINHIDISPCGNYIVTASCDKTACIWDLKTGERVTEPLMHDRSVEKAVFSPCGRYVATLPSDKSIRVWSVRNGEPLSNPLQHDVYPDDFAFSPNGDLLVSSCYKGLYVWSVSTGELITGPIKFNNSVKSFKFSSCGKYIVSKLSNHSTSVLSVETWTDVTEFMETDKGFVAEHFAPYVVEKGEVAEVWYDKKINSYTNSIKYDKSVEKALYTPDGKHIAVVSKDSTVVVFNAATCKPTGASLGFDNRIMTLAFSPDGRNLTVVLKGGGIKVIDMKTMDSVPVTVNNNDNAEIVTFSADGNAYLAITANKKTQIRNSKSGETLVELSDAKNIHVADFSYCGRYIASTSFDRTATVWDTFTGKKIWSIEHDDNVRTACFSPDGKYLLTSAGRNTFVHDVVTHRVICTLYDNVMFHSAVFSPDGKNILTASNGNNVNVWPFPPLQELIDKYRKDPEHDWSLTQEEKDEYSLE